MSIKLTKHFVLNINHEFISNIKNKQLRKIYTIFFVNKTHLEFIKQTKSGLIQIKYNKKYYSIPSRCLKEVER